MAKEIINVEVKARKVDLGNLDVELLAVGLFSGEKSQPRFCKELDAKLGGAIGKVMELGDFKAKANTTSIIYTDGGIAAKRVVLVGMGKKKKADLDTLRQAAAVAASKAVEMNAATVGLAMHQGLGRKMDLAKAGKVIAEGAYFGSYRYDEFVTKSDDGRPKSVRIEVVDRDGQVVRKLKGGIDKGVIIGRAQSYARTIANRPGNIMTPVKLAAEAKKVANSTAGLSCTVFDEKQLKQKQMGGILAVGQGSVNKPVLIILEYNPPAGRSKSKAPVVGLVGKAVTFDSGGLSIKPAARMDQMKFDKSGGVAVLGVMKAVAELKLPMKIFGIIPAAENMPSASSYRPGDIVTTFGGKTVEVLNTDAEGRMILCDALSYAVKQDCDVIIDVATLTGACLVALGKHKAGLMGNDDKLIKQLQKAAEESGEKVWPMPSGEEYLAEMKSEIADLKNIGSRWGGACTAAAFLSQFVDDKKWAHVDMAGMDMFEANKHSGAAGASGFGVRLFVSYLINLAKG